MMMAACRRRAGADCLHGHIRLLTLPAFSNSSVAFTRCPFSNGFFSPISITWNEPGLSSTAAPGLIQGRLPPGAWS